MMYDWTKVAFGIFTAVTNTINLAALRSVRQNKW